MSYELVQAFRPKLCPPRMPHAKVIMAAIHSGRGSHTRGQFFCSYWRKWRKRVPTDRLPKGSILDRRFRRQVKIFFKAFLRESDTKLQILVNAAKANLLRKSKQASCATSDAEIVVGSFVCLLV